MPDTIILDGGVTDDQTPELRIELDAPLDGGQIRLKRDDVFIGNAIQDDDLHYHFVDNVTVGNYIYVAEVTKNGQVNASAPFHLEIVDNGPPAESVFFTSSLYGYPFEDALSVAVATIVGGFQLDATNDYLSIGFPQLTDGVLESVIAFKTVDVLPDKLSILTPTLVAGELFAVIGFKQAEGLLDKLQTNVPQIVSGQITTVIGFVDYTIPVEKLNISIPTISSGELI
jgi:hypothetical protein